VKEQEKNQARRSPGGDAAQIATPGFAAVARGAIISIEKRHSFSFQMGVCQK
jgi:hypothetical protein